MSTPTDYKLKYSDDYCADESPGCNGPCKKKIKFTSRESEFCRDVTLQQNLAVMGTVDITPPEITVGGLTFRPGIVTTFEGPVTVLRL